MLKALKQLEVKSPQPPQASEPVTPEQSDAERQTPPDEVPQTGVETDRGGTSRDEGVIEAAFSRVEIAAAAVGQQLDETASDSQAAPWPVRSTRRHAQAYRELAQNVLSQLPTGRPVVLMFTSPSDGEGKTETLASLAAALAERTAERVLLLDGNLHKPDLASCLDVEVTGSLAQVLGGEASWQRVVRRTSVPHLDLLPGAKSPHGGPHPPEQLRLRALLDELRSQYRLVLIDAASLAHAEVAPMAGCCDGTYLVVRLRHTARRELARAAEVIQDCSGHLLGSVVIGG
jgi:Mrp family chromosome partitioning ATPase